MLFVIFLLSVVDIRSPTVYICRIKFVSLSSEISLKISARRIYARSSFAVAMHFIFYESDPRAKGLENDRERS